MVFSNTQEEHLNHLFMVATILRDSNIVLSERKVSINKTKIEFLGAEFEDGRNILQPNVLQNLEKFPNVMTDKKILQRFFGGVSTTLPHIICH